MKKKLTIKSVLQNFLNPSVSANPSICNKDYQEYHRYHNLISNGDNEKLNNSKSEANCRNNAHINKKQSCKHIKLCQPKSSNSPSKNNN